MKKLLLLFVCLLSINVLQAQQQLDFAKNDLVIQFKSEYLSGLNIKIQANVFGNAPLDALNQKHHLQEIQLTGNKKLGNTYCLIFSDKQDILNLVEEYNATGLFEYVEPNYIGFADGQKVLLPLIPNDSHFYLQWGLHNDGTFAMGSVIAGSDIDMLRAWDIEQGDSNIIVAVLDGGIKMDHPEFQSRIWYNKQDSLNGQDSDSNGYVDDIKGWDFAYNDNDPSDDAGHGTNVAGIIGANGNNNSGLAGVDWNCKLMSCKILNSNNYGYYTWWADAIYYAVDNGARVLNMSVAGTNYSSLLQSAVDYAYTHGVTIVAAMGNSDDATIFYPAAFQNTIAVGSTDPDDKRSSPFFWNTNSGSCYGNHIDVVAPGNFIYGLNYLSDNDYTTYWGGTSQAAPHVSGLCALLLAQDSTRTPDDLRAVLRGTAEDQVGDPSEDIAGFDIYYGYGRINAYNALQGIYQGVDSPAKSNLSLLVFPNPAMDFVEIQSSKAFNCISIKNILGQEVYRLESVKNITNIKINITSLPKGIYLVSVENSFGEAIAIRKIIVE